MFQKKIYKERGQQLKHKAAIRIAAAVQKIHNAFAAYMNRKTANIPGSKMKIAVAVFFGICSLYSLYLVLDATFKTGTKYTPMTITKIRSPRLQPGAVISNNRRQKHIPTKAEFLKRSLDEIKQKPAGKRWYDSMIQVHPGLLDSVEFLEQFFLNNKK